MKKTIFILVLLGCAGLFFGYFNKFDKQVQEQFQGRLWELPARVYARPLEVYPSMQLVPELFEKELILIGYRKQDNSNGLDTPGTYARMGNTFDLFLRAFDFGDETLPLRRTRVRIKDNRVIQVKNIKTGRDREMDRLDPVMVGRFYPASMEDRVLVTLDQTPPLLGKSIVAVEDRNFYTHYGIDPKAIFRAILVNIKNRRLSQGASTLTQQLAKNFFLTREKTLVRKINETFMAAALELHFSKDEILEAYINEVYLGQDGKRSIHGFGLAADFYFGKSPANLAPHEIALLVGMLKGPSAYNPRTYPDQARQRRNVVLKLMADQGLISPSQLKQGLTASLGVIQKPTQGHSPFPFYLDLVKRQLLKEYRENDLRTMGLRIFTALDPQVQLAAEQAVSGFLKNKDSHLEAGLVFSDTATNEIHALVGGKDFRYMGFNRALDARRPIGSLVKPAVYLTALAQPDTYTLVSRVNDGPVKIKNYDGTFWQPQNFDRTSHGQVGLFQALVHSYNTATVRLGLDLGLENVSNTLKKLGANPEPPVLPSILLGSMDMSPIQVAQMYHTLASGGFYTPARAIRTIYTLEGEALQRYDLTIEQRMNPGAVFLVNKMLQGVVSRGTGKSLNKWLSPDYSIAGKTGTTNDLKDSWFAGFSGNHLAVVWIGRDDNQSTGLTGSSGALQVFGRLMSKISNSPLDLAVPENIEWGIIDSKTGYRTNGDCPNAVSAPFIRGSVPEEFQPCESAFSPIQTGDQPVPRSSSKAAPPKKVKTKYLMDWFKEVFK
ncbi:MrcB [Desulforapulum autotrophicum HRM2]|uniref:Penicillin-binding protein 1B n=1 Tax=Desulforapulum autotrophicum (strain ATCC 43914 / DSM 3382 / VKM B-1955 / HRM2) TaxID=177437 RepID=C0QA60_DESAH|nr:penicillin-binding protein 1B [Desulforapulum autotrophicum]ACN14645.1 MrcB [Desulforapulum autotrophicum HRM2]